MTASTFNIANLKDKYDIPLKFIAEVLGVSESWMSLKKCRNDSLTLKEGRKLNIALNERHLYLSGKFEIEINRLEELKKQQEADFRERFRQGHIHILEDDNETE